MLHWLPLGEHARHLARLVTQIAVAVPHGDDADPACGGDAEVLREQGLVLSAFEEHAREAIGFTSALVIAELEVEARLLRGVLGDVECIGVQRARGLGDPQRPHVDAEEADGRHDAPRLDPRRIRDLEGGRPGREVILGELAEGGNARVCGDDATQDDGSTHLVDRLVQGRIGDHPPVTVVHQHGAARLPRDAVAEGEDVVDGLVRPGDLGHVPPWSPSG